MKSFGFNMKPFFFRVDAAKFLAAVVVVPENKRGEWVLSLALDMVEANVDNCKSSFAKEIIKEASNFSEKKRNAGKLGGLAKASTAKVCSSTAVAKASIPLASNSSSNSNKEQKTCSVDIEKVINYLNRMTGRKFKHTTGAVKKVIQARANEGFVDNDFKVVIDNQCNEWKNDPVMEKYLRPETLFGTKFDGYLNNTTKKKESYMDMNGIMQER